MTGGPARMLHGATVDERIVAICTEIAETVLPRTLVFHIGDDAEIALDAGGRRLMRILRAAPATLAPADGPAFRARDDARAAEQLGAIGALLAAFADRAGEMNVTSGVASAIYPASAVGFSPERLREAAAKAAPVRKKAAAAIPAAPEPAAPAADPTDALKALIGKMKVAPSAPPAAPAGRAGRGRAASEDAIRTFYAALEQKVAFAAILNREGNVEAVSGNQGNEEILACAADIVADLARWRKFTRDAVAPTQVMVLRAGGVQNHSIAFFADDYGVALAVFVNTDLSRVLGAANAILPGGGTK